ncbi:hypothetical protein ILFOPFJJ_01692 [Ensifer psoraleae]|uniref:hypothetical protein n=1 Tax=Sinorhizobium psoraleae TaxID=520838 RepID=UPI00156820A6|nr:hypothetical protein [Sinorhizobium psoraleae]NRP70810.1 hypothetical protein [Sinorhizobium psoraleae]
MPASGKMNYHGASHPSALTGVIAMAKNYQLGRVAIPRQGHGPAGSFRHGVASFIEPQIHLPRRI